MPKAPDEKLTPKERMFVDAYVNGDKKTRGNKAQSALLVYNTKSRRNAGLIANSVSQRPRVRNEIDRLLKKHNLTDDLIFRKLKEGLDANLPVFWKGEGQLTDIPDHVARHKYLQDLLKIVSAFPPERREVHKMNIDLAVEKLPPEEVRVLLQGLLKKTYGNIKNSKRSGQKELPSGSDGKVREEDN